MATLVSFWSFFGDRLANLGLVEFKLGWYINVNVNTGQNKFISLTFGQNYHQLAQVGQMPLLGKSITGHDSVFFIQF